jgi:RNA polymerase sigma-70 factor (ECF subfamily)
VLGYLLRRCADLGLAEDCTAETFAIAWQNAADGVPHPGWIFVTARNVLANHQRAEVRLTELRNRLGVEASRGPWPGLAPPVDYDDPTAQRLVEAMELLSSEQCDLLMAHYWDGLSGAECAELFDCSPAAVWVRLHRARRTLADLYLTHRSMTEPTGPSSAGMTKAGNEQT